MKPIFTLIAFLSAAVAMAKGPTGYTPQFRSNLYIIDTKTGDPVLMDGTLSLYNDTYNDGVDRNDARKMFNPSENWGMVRGSSVLIVERKTMVKSQDTIFFKMWNMRVITYRLEFIGKYFDNEAIEGTLIDKYLNKETPVSIEGTTFVDFQVTSDPQSKREDRFMLVFKNNVAKGALPLSFTNVTARSINNSVSISWATVNEKNVTHYEVERSSDGIQFERTGDAVQAANELSNTYTLIDAAPGSGVNYYRVKATDRDGKSTLSDVVKVMMQNVQAVITVYPNPATATNINIKMRGHQEGIYQLTVMNGLGNVLYRQSQKLSNAEQLIKLTPGQQLVPGMYRVEVTGPDGFRKVVSLLINH